MRCRTPQGVRGLKLLSRTNGLILRGRTPQGVRGLKLYGGIGVDYNTKSHPARGAWIEILTLIVITYEPLVAPRKGCVD